MRNEQKKIVRIYSSLNQNTMNTKTQSPEITLSNDKVEISLNHVITTKAKENETAKQLAKRIAKEKRAATNQARQILAKDIKSQLFNLEVIELIFSTNSRAASEVFLAKLSDETGKEITIEKVLKLPKREILDYVKEIEAARGMIRGGINPTEYTNIIARYYRGIKVGAITDKDTLLAVYNQEII